MRYELTRYIYYAESFDKLKKMVKDKYDPNIEYKVCNPEGFVGWLFANVQFSVTEHDGIAQGVIARARTLKKNHFRTKEEALNDWEYFRNDAELKALNDINELSYVVGGKVIVEHCGYEYEVVI